MSTFITKLISSINFSVTVPNSLAATTAIEKREKEREGREKERIEEQRKIMKSPLPFTGKSWANLSNP